MRQYSFSLTQKLHIENPNHQNNSFYILRIGFTMGYKKSQNFFTRQYLRGSAICLRPRSCRDFTIIKEKYKVQQYSFSLTQKLHLENLNHQNNSFYILRTGFIIGYKTGQKFFTRQYLHGSAIFLHPRNCRDFTIIKEKYKVR